MQAMYFLGHQKKPHDEPQSKAQQHVFEKPNKKEGHKKLISLSKGSRPLNITWYYEKNRDAILNLGREISTHYDHPFKFVEVFKIKDQLRQAS